MYTLVGGIATIVEWVCFYGLANCLQFHHMIATIIAYILSTFSNWALGKVLVFKKHTTRTILQEIISVYIVSVVGLVFNLLIMWVFVDVLLVNKMMAKIVATVVVFGWNFLIRKLVIYKKGGR